MPSISSRPGPTAIIWLVALLLAALAPFILAPYDLNLIGRFLALSLTGMGLVLLWAKAGC